MHKRLTALVIPALLMIGKQPAAADYPNRPLRIIVPFASGSGADIASRHLANELNLPLGQQVVVDNRPGASGIIGYEMRARAVPDGYTLGYMALPLATNPSVYSKLPYENNKDFQPIILFTSGVTILAVSPSLPIRSVKELIEHARAKPGTLSFGSTGVGSGSHLSMELLKGMTGTNMVPVSYKGIRQQISKEVARILNLPDVRERLNAVAFHIAPTTPEEHERKLQADNAAFATVIKDIGLKPN